VLTCTKDGLARVWTLPKRLGEAAAAAAAAVRKNRTFDP
jgi:hypothetical protein